MLRHVTAWPTACSDTIPFRRHRRTRRLARPGGLSHGRFPKKTLADWTALATKDTGGASPDTLVWDTPEGIPVKPLYTADDLAGLELETLPGFAPFTRGPRATMYSHRP